MTPGFFGRFRYSWGLWRRNQTARPRSLAGYLRLLWHDFVIHPLLEGGERCQDCGRKYPLWRAADDLWRDVIGSPGGLYCPSCFAGRAREAGLKVMFIAGRFKVIFIAGRFMAIFIAGRFMASPKGSG